MSRPKPGSDRATPAFIPYKIQRDPKLTQQSRRIKFREKEIKLTPSTLANGFIPRKKNSVAPILTRAEVHSNPGAAAIIDELKFRDASTMTVHSILRNNNSNKLNGALNGLVPNGFINSTNFVSSIHNDVAPSGSANETDKLIGVTIVEDHHSHSGNQDKPELKIIEEEKEIEDQVVVKEIASSAEPQKPESLKVESMAVPHKTLKQAMESRLKNQLQVKQVTIPRSPSIIPHNRLTTARHSIVSRSSQYSELTDYRTAPSRQLDLRKILNPEEDDEKENSLKVCWDSIVNCECFEWNLNNAAKMITFVVLMVTLILVVNSLSRRF